MLAETRDNEWSSDDATATSYDDGDDESDSDTTLEPVKKDCTTKYIWRQCYAFTGECNGNHNSNKTTF